MSTSQTTIERLLDHYDEPRNYGPLDNPSVSARGGFEECDDTVTVYLDLDQDTQRIRRMSFEGQGCTISQGAASILSELVVNMPISEAAALTDAAIIDILGRDVVSARPKCATLALHTLQRALYLSGTR